MTGAAPIGKPPLSCFFLNELCCLWVVGVLLYAQQVECHAVVGAGAVLGNGGTVGPGGVAFVFVPVVLRELLVQLHHVIVAVGLGQDRRGGNGEVAAVAFYFA